MSRIVMGNDEFILYIRKQNKKCDLTNDQLGKKIWEWLRDKAQGKEVKENMKCLWGKNADNIGEKNLPYTATQFEFDRDKLSELYESLDDFISDSKYKE
jgi:hypothetical protein